MKTYFDSSALVAVYVTERFSDRAREEVRRAGQVPWAGLHELEVRNTLRLLYGRRIIDARQARALAGHVDEDVRGGRLVRIEVDYRAVFSRSCDLAQQHSARLLCRSLDILHVACALDLACDGFVSGDDRQLRLARATGLKVVDITAPAPVPDPATEAGAMTVSNEGPGGRRTRSRVAYPGRDAAHCGPALLRSPQ